jgi:hypothetical protein
VDGRAAASQLLASVFGNTLQGTRAHLRRECSGPPAAAGRRTTTPRFGVTAAPWASACVRSGGLSIGAHAFDHLHARLHKPCRTQVQTQPAAGPINIERLSAHMQVAAVRARFTWAGRRPSAACMNACFWIKSDRMPEYICGSARAANQYASPSMHAHTAAATSRAGLLCTHRSTSL